MSPCPHIRSEKSGYVTTIIIDKPETRNAVDGIMAAALRDAFLAHEADDESRVAVFYGAGGNFCAGADLKAVNDRSRAHELDPKGGGTGPIASRMALTKPVIAAIEGFAVAGGLELACMADMRIADDSAVFGVFCRRWGVPLIDGGTVRLPRIIGMGRAMDMILTGRPVDAEEALSFGLANRVVLKGTARQEAEKLAHQLAEFPQHCMRADRASAHQQWNFSLAEAIKNEGKNGAPIVAIEARKGAMRFEKGAGRHGNFNEHQDETE